MIAQRSILDNNAGLTNVTAGNLRIQADSNSNNTGIIASQADAIETSVDILAAKSADGIYIQEANGVTVNNIAEIVVQQVNFNSTLSNVNIDDETLEDLSTTNNGAIKLQATLGNIEINAGAAGNPAISAQGTGDVLLQTLGNSGDITINGNVQSGNGHITLNASDDAVINATVSTGGNGSLYINAGNNFSDAGVQVDGVNLNASLSTTNGDILVNSAMDIRQNASVTSTLNGDIGLIAFRNVIQNANTGSSSGDVLIEASNGDWLMANGVVVNVGGGDFTGRASGNIVLSQIFLNNASTNLVALESLTGSIVDANGAAVNVQELSPLRRLH